MNGKVGRAVEGANQPTLFGYMGLARTRAEIAFAVLPLLGRFSGRRITNGVSGALDGYQFRGRKHPAFEPFAHR